MRMRGVALDDLPLLDAYWTVYAYYTMHLDEDGLARMHRILDEKPKVATPREDGLSADDVHYLAQLGLSPEDVRRAARRRDKNQTETE